MKRQTGLGLVTICVLLFSAFAAANASAAGTTAYTCKKVTPIADTVGFSDAHCLSAVTTNANYEHVAITPGAPTTFSAQNLNTSGVREAATLTTVVALTPLEIKCNKVETHGKLTNVEPTGEEMQVHGTEIVFSYRECTVPKPEKNECKIKGGEFKTNPLTSTTFGKAAPEEMGVKVQPEAGEVFFELALEGCKNAGLNKVFPYTGSYKASASGTTLTTTPALSEGTLKFGGASAKLTQTQTVKMIPATGGTEEDGIALTTV